MSTERLEKKDGENSHRAEKTKSFPYTKGLLLRELSRVFIRKAQKKLIFRSQILRYVAQFQSTLKEPPSSQTIHKGLPF